MPEKLTVKVANLSRAVRPLGQRASLPSLPPEPYVSGAPSEIGGSGSQLGRRRAPIVLPAAW